MLVRSHYPGPLLVLMGALSCSTLALAQESTAPGAPTAPVETETAGQPTEDPYTDRSTTGTQPPATTQPAQPTPPDASSSVEASAGYSTSGNYSAAQTTTPQYPPPPPPPGVAAQGPVAPGMAREPVEPSDHERVVRNFGVGLLSTAEIRNLVPGAGFQDDPLGIAIVGTRYWFSDRLGLQGGFGFNTHSGTRQDDIPGNVDVDEPTLWGLAFHAGVPISIYYGEHYNFLLIPELNVGYSTGRTDDNGNTPGDQGVENDAWLLGLGLKVGAEIQFGFIDLPMLALQGTVGATLAYRRAQVETVENGSVVNRAKWTLDAETLSHDDPWDLFTSSIAALYYFE